jgi:hypothetical protein
MAVQEDVAADEESSRGGRKRWRRAADLCIPRVTTDAERREPRGLVILTKTDRKFTTGLAGEFLVAGELLRRGIMAAVTYGNAKKADVVAFGAGRSVLLEVKSTSEPKWVLGSGLPSPDVGLWALVLLPRDTKVAPSYFIISGTELRALVMPKHERFMQQYRAKHGSDFSGSGVCSVERALIGSQYQGAWQKVTEALGIDGPAPEQS